MSVLCCRIPDFLVTLALRDEPRLAGAPLALLGGDAHVWAASPEAEQCGVYAGMLPRQARVRCPDLLLRPVDASRSQAEQDAFLGEMARWELPVEEHGWGAAYLDLHTVAVTPTAVQPLAAELGRRVRQSLGSTLQPALGWDSSKFTARAASTRAAPGAMRMVGKAEEAHFLGPLPVSLLPLPEAALQQLGWLGIRTLAQFAALPTTAVWQRYGQAGKVAQRWALGKDNRPVCGNLRTPPETLLVDFDPPTDQAGRVLADVLLALHPLLQRLAANLAGCRRLRLALHFLGRQTPHTLDITFVEPAAQEARIRNALAQELQALVWPGELDWLEVTLQESSNLVPAQLSLFAGEGGAEAAPVMELAHRLAGRYGRCFFLGQIVEATHPVAERVFRMQYA